MSHRRASACIAGLQGPGFPQRFAVVCALLGTVACGSSSGSGGSWSIGNDLCRADHFYRLESAEVPVSYIAELDLVLLTFRERETAVAVHGPRESPTEFTVGLGGFDLDGNGVFSEIVTDPVQTAGGGRFGHGGQMLSVDIAIPGDRIIEVGPLLRTEPNAAFEAGLRSCG